MIHCCAHNKAFTAVWSLMAQRGLACSARRDGMHLGSAIRTADLETFTLWLSGHYRRKMVKRIQVGEPRSALWPWVMCSMLETKDWGVSEEDRKSLILKSAPQNTFVDIKLGIFERLILFFTCKANMATCINVYIWLHKVDIFTWKLFYCCISLHPAVS